MIPMSITIEAPSIYIQNNGMHVGVVWPRGRYALLSSYGRDGFTVIESGTKPIAQALALAAPMRLGTILVPKAFPWQVAIFNEEVLLWNVDTCKLVFMSWFEGDVRLSTSTADSLSEAVKAACDRALSTAP